jgi:hypothetical protein
MIACNLSAAILWESSRAQHENGVLLIGPFDFERVRELVFQTDLSNRHTPRPLLPLIHAHAILLPLRGS